MKTTEISSLYLHFPYCVHLCNYCDFYKHKLIDSSQITKFEGLLEDSWQAHHQLLKGHGANFIPLETLYLGGGTPSLWGVDGASFFSDNFLNKRIFLNDDCEFTMEVDPGTYTKETIAAWQRLGVNRFSLGVQAFDDHQLKFLDRVHREEDVENSLKYFKSLNVNYSVDILIGAPSEKKRNIKQEIERFLDYDPNHFSVYILQTRKNYPHLKKVPLDEAISEEYLLVVELLESNGFGQYEVSNFSTTGMQSRHNLKYWKYESVAGLGPNATGLIVKNKNEALRYQWKSLSAGHQLEVLNSDEISIEKVYLALRNAMGLEKSYFDHVDTVGFEKVLLKWSKLGYLKDSKEVIKLTSLGYLMLDSLMDDLFTSGLL